jgi:hypothetical protein
VRRRRSALVKAPYVAWSIFRAPSLRLFHRLTKSRHATVMHRGIVTAQLIFRRRRHARHMTVRQRGR